MKFSRDVDMEKHLLDLVLTVRGSGGKGLKKKVWRSIEEAMKARFDRDMEGKCQTKYQRLMAQYKTYHYVSNLSGAGIDPQSHKVTLDPSVWMDLMGNADANTQCTYRMLQKSGFAHANVCLSSAVDAADSPEVHGSGDAIGEDGDLQLPPSHEQRAIKVKRLRDGRAKSAAASTAIAVSTDRPLEAFIGACKASEDFFRKRTKQLDSRDSADAIVSNSSESDKQYC
ncbi:hypothetical protein DVH05_017828 [Phytophthora capsici]|nr:hypothetical protein DVH05_017828 [Phytophthora capsici]